MSQEPDNEPETSFSITFVIKTFENLVKQSSPVVEHFGRKWYMTAAEASPDASFHDPRRWEISIICEKADLYTQKRSLSRQLYAKATLSYVKPAESLIVTGKRTKLDHYADVTVLSQKIGRGRSMDNQMIVHNSVTIKCDWTVDVDETAPTPKFDFGTRGNSRISDVTLVVEQREFHVAKAVLASFSTYFNIMFYEKFSESKESKITLEDVDADEFQTLLEVIYHKNDVTLDNARELLELTTYFDMKDIRDKCEQVLVKSPPLQVPTDQKLLLADKYMLPELMKHAMGSLKTVEQIQKVCPEKVDNLNPSTIKAILQRVVDLRPKH